MAIQTLRETADLALLAPSIFNTQPWAWIVESDRMQLRADRTRQLPVVDPDGRLLTISCGVALHYARLALAGTLIRVALLPDPNDPDLLATIQLTGEPIDGSAAAPLLRAVKARRTDRRPFTKTPVDQETVASFVAVCAAQHAQLHVVRPTQISKLALAAIRAGALQLSTPGYRAELSDWTHRPPWSGDGVPIETAVDTVPRSVPVRDFAPFDADTLKMGIDNDLGATYGIICTHADTPRDWLHAGQALSAVLLTATAAGLGTASISDVTEAEVSRNILRDMVESGEPQVAVRIGHRQPGNIPPVSRRLAEEAITIIETESSSWASPSS